MMHHPFIAAQNLSTLQPEEVVALKELICNTIPYIHGESPLIPSEIRLQAYQDPDDTDRLEVWISRAESNECICKVWIFEDGRILRDILYYFIGPMKAIEDYKNNPKFIFHVHGFDIHLYDILKYPNNEINDSTLLFIEWDDLPKGMTTLRKENIHIAYSPYTTSEVVPGMIAMLPDEIKKDYAWESSNPFSIGTMELRFIRDEDLTEYEMDTDEFHDIDHFECDAYNLPLDSPSFDPRQWEGIHIVNERLVEFLVKYAESRRHILPAKAVQAAPATTTTTTTTTTAATASMNALIALTKMGQQDLYLAQGIP